jgi:3-oxoadipate enol-lactonase
MSDGWVPQLPPGRPVHLPGRGDVFVREVAGPPGAPVVILSHGWTVTADLNWFGVFEPLGRHFRVLAFDHRGHGRGIRSSQRFRIADCADDIVAVADAFGVDRFLCVGYSMGGAIASLVWKRHPERVSGIVLCATARSFSGTWKLRLQFAVFRPASYVARIVPDRLSSPVYRRVIWQRTRDRGFEPWALEQIRSGDPRAVIDGGSELGAFDSTGWIGEIDVPAAVVVVEDDTIVEPCRQKALAEAIPHATAWRIDGDHDVCVRHPYRFADVVVGACRQVAEQSGVTA